MVTGKTQGEDGGWRMEDGGWRMAKRDGNQSEALAVRNRMKKLIQKIVFAFEARKKRFFEKARKAHGYWLALMFRSVFSENNKSVSILL